MSRQERGIPEYQQPQPDTNLKRRDVLKRMLGGASVGIGLLGGYTNIALPIKADKETRIELQADGLTKPDPQALKLPEQIRKEGAEQTLQNRTPQEAWQAIQTQAQDDRYEREYKKRYLEKTGFLTGRLRPVMLGFNAFNIAIGGYYLLRRRGEQDESTEQYQYVRALAGQELDEPMTQIPQTHGQSGTIFVHAPSENRSIPTGDNRDVNTMTEQEIDEAISRMERESVTFNSRNTHENNNRA